MVLKLLVNPLSKGAYFANVLSVAKAEVWVFYPNIEIQISQVGTMTFLDVELSIEEAPVLVRLSFVQGIFYYKDKTLHILDISPLFDLLDQPPVAAHF